MIFAEIRVAISGSSHFRPLGYQRNDEHSCDKEQSDHDGIKIRVVMMIIPKACARRRNPMPEVACYGDPRNNYLCNRSEN